MIFFSFLDCFKNSPVRQKERNNQSIQAGIISNGFFLKSVEKKYTLKTVKRVQLILSDFSLKWMLCKHLTDLLQPFPRQSD